MNTTEQDLCTICTRPPAMCACPDAPRWNAGTDSIVAELITLHLARAQKGAEKYGTTLDRTDLTEEQWEQHLLEELMDGALYLLRWRKQRAEGDKRLCDFMNNRDGKQRARIAELEAENRRLQAGDGWRDASKEKPEALTTVLAYLRTCSETRTGFFQEGIGWHVGDEWILNPHAVTHWRELPAPPKGEEGK